jgi:hypothetical protein
MSAAPDDREDPVDWSHVRLSSHGSFGPRAGPGVLERRFVLRKSLYRRRLCCPLASRSEDPLGRSQLDPNRREPLPALKARMRSHGVRGSGGCDALRAWPTLLDPVPLATRSGSTVGGQATTPARGDPVRGQTPFSRPARGARAATRFPCAAPCPIRRRAPGRLDDPDRDATGLHGRSSGPSASARPPSAPLSHWNRSCSVSRDMRQSDAEGAEKPAAIFRFGAGR